jgi:hypothetical protein
MTRLEFINAERDLVLTMLGLALIAVLVMNIGESAVAGVILLLAMSMLGIIVLAMCISDEGRFYLHKNGHKGKS